MMEWKSFDKRERQKKSREREMKDAENEELGWWKFLKSLSLRHISPPHEQRAADRAHFLAACRIKGSRHRRRADNGDPLGNATKKGGRPRSLGRRLSISTSRHRRSILSSSSELCPVKLKERVAEYLN